MRVLETQPSIDLPDHRVAVAGDWHGNLGWVKTVGRGIHRLAPEVTTVLQLGDWWLNPEQADEVLQPCGIERVLVTLGNHEPWGELSPLLDEHPGMAVRVSALHWILPRPFRFTVGGRAFLSLGGAASVDRMWRQEGRNWWADEEITDEHVQTALTLGPADVMLTHESPAGSPVRAVRDMLRTNPQGWPRDALDASTASRIRVSQVWDAARPEILFHGHMHLPGGGTTEDGRRVLSLGCDSQRASVAFLDTQDLEVEFPALHDLLG